MVKLVLASLIYLFTLGLFSRYGLPHFTIKRGKQENLEIRIYIYTQYLEAEVNSGVHRA